MSALDRVRALQRDCVEAAFAEVCASASLRDRGLCVTTGASSSERAREIEARSTARRLADCIDDVPLEPGAYVGSTLVIEEADGVGRAVHPSAGVLLVALVIHVRPDGVTASTQATHFMLFDRTLHTMERPLPGALEDVTRAMIVQHVLDALTFFALHAMSLTSPFAGGTDA